MATDGRPPGLLSPYETIKLSVDRGDTYSAIRLKEFEHMGEIEAGGEEQAWDAKCELCTDVEVRCFVPGANNRTSKCSFCYYRKTPCSLASLSYRRAHVSTRLSSTPRPTSHQPSTSRSASRRERSRSPRRDPSTQGQSFEEFLSNNSFLGSQANHLRGRPPMPRSRFARSTHDSSEEDDMADGGAKVAEDERVDLLKPVERLEREVAVGKSLSPMSPASIPFRLNQLEAARKTCPPLVTTGQAHTDIHLVVSSCRDSAPMDTEECTASGDIKKSDDTEARTAKYRAEIATLKDRLKFMEDENADLKRRMQLLKTDNLALATRVEESEAEDREQRRLLQELEARLNGQG